MENILTYELISGLYNPSMSALMFGFAYLGVDVVKLHNNLPYFSKAHITVIFSAPIAAMYILSGIDWQVVLGTYALTVAAYDLILKNIKSKML